MRFWTDRPSSVNHQALLLSNAQNWEYWRSKLCYLNFKASQIFCAVSFVFSQVLLYSGQLDIIVAAPLTEHFLPTVLWSKVEDYKNAERLVWKIHPQDKEVAGYVRQAGDFYQVGKGSLLDILGILSYALSFLILKEKVHCISIFTHKSAYMQGKVELLRKILIKIAYICFLELSLTL